MEYTAVIEFFEALQCVKRKYRMIAVYYKYMTEIRDNEKKRDEEVECFKRFLKANVNSVNERRLDKPEYRGTKTTFIVSFNSILDSLGDNQDMFWSKLADMYTLFCVKPDEPVEMSASASADIEPEEDDRLIGALSVIKDNPVYTDIVENIIELKKNKDVADISSFNDMIKSGAFDKFVTTLSRNMSKGQYNVDNIIDAAGGIVNMLEKDYEPNPEIKQSLGMVSKLLTTARSGNGIDMTQITELMSMLQWTQR